MYGDEGRTVILSSRSSLRTSREWHTAPYTVHTSGINKYAQPQIAGVLSPPPRPPQSQPFTTTDTLRACVNRFLQCCLPFHSLV
jgi:hypothetical protein